MTRPISEHDRLFFLALERVCRERDVVPRPARVVLAHWAFSRQGQAGLFGPSLNVTDKRSRSRRQPGWLNRMEIMVDVDRLVQMALPDAAAVEELHVYAALGSMARAADFLRRRRGRRLDQNLFSKRVRRYEALAADVLRYAGYVD